MRNSRVWGKRTDLVTGFFSLGFTSESQCDVVLLKPAWPLFPPLQYGSDIPGFATDLF